MASSLNASTSGGGGVIVTSDATGNLNIQSGGSTVVAVTSTGATVTGTLAATGAVTLTGSLNTPNTFGFKNRIINGGMVIDQRNAGASVTPTNGQYSVDRWQFQVSQASKLTAQQSSVAPTGFSNSLLVTSTSTYSVVAADYFSVLQSIEGFNTADLAFGTASAATVTLSFWVRSSLTGTFGGTLINSAYSRAYPFTYTISNANTWEQKSVTITGDTTGTWIGATNGAGLQVNFGLGVGANNSGTAGAWTGSGKYSATGAVSVVGTSGATFYITGVQLEKGSTATSFDFRAYSTELAMCQRYYQIVVPNSGTTGSGFVNGTTQLWTSTPFKTTMRASSTVSITGTISGVKTTWSGSSLTLTSYTVSTQTTDETSLYGVVSSGLTTGQGGFLSMGASNQVVASAEL